MRIGVVLAGGAASQSPGSHSSDQWVPGGVHSAAVVVAADSGLDLARRLGIRPTLVVGDFDSVTRDALMWAAEEGIEMVPFPTDKDETDLDLAIGAVGVFAVAVLVGVVESTMARLRLVRVPLMLVSATVLAVIALLWALR